MAHFAEINSDNKVLRVLVVADEQEHRGQEFLAEDCNLGGTWVQTSYNGTFGDKFAAVGDKWDGTNFVPPTLEELIAEGSVTVEEPTE